MGEIVWTAEQREAIAIRAGVHVLTANAGTGKSTTLSRLFFELYLDLERRLYPGLPAGHHVDGAKQAKLLAQFLVVTFTKPAAADLNAKIHGELRAAGIPEPLDKKGSQRRICRTLDSWIRRWFTFRAVAMAALKHDEDWVGCLGELLMFLPASTKSKLGAGNAAEARLKLVNSWPWLIDDSASEMLFALTARKYDGLEPLPGLDLDELARDHIAFAQNWDLGMDRGPGWFQAIERWQDRQRKYRQLGWDVKRGKVDGAQWPDLEGALQELELWQNEQGRIREFLSIYDIARARGYHPRYSPGALGCKRVLNALSATRQIASFELFHQLAQAYYTTKLRFAARDHTDFLVSFVRTIQREEWLLEKDRDLPTYGIRARNVLYDEQQDNTLFQNVVFKSFMPGQGAGGVAVAVGDGKQAVYGWRGASAYGFADIITEVKREGGEANVHGLTVSFRSRAGIVELGNNIASSLATFKDRVLPSQACVEGDAHLEVAPPLLDQIDEANWVHKRILEIREKDPIGSIMILHRKNLQEHPILPLLKAFDRVNLMTIHKSKGLEADWVFVLGLTAGVLPDVRGSLDQEANLFYVAATRARIGVFFVAPITEMEKDKDGNSRRVIRGASTYIWKVPVLRELAVKSGWNPDVDEEKSLNTEASASAKYWGRVNERRSALWLEFKALWGTGKGSIAPVEAKGDEHEEPDGAAEANGDLLNEEPQAVGHEGHGPRQSIAFVRQQNLYGADGRLDLTVTPRLDQAIKEKLTDMMRFQFYKNGRVPNRLTTQQSSMAQRLGMITIAKGRWAFTDAFEQECLRQTAR